MTKKLQDIALAINYQVLEPTGEELEGLSSQEKVQVYAFIKLERLAIAERVTLKNKFLLSIGDTKELVKRAR